MKKIIPAKKAYLINSLHSCFPSKYINILCYFLLSTVAVHASSKENLPGIPLKKVSIFIELR